MFTLVIFSFFFFNDTATTEIYTLSLHDALPICTGSRRRWSTPAARRRPGSTAGCGSLTARRSPCAPDRKSTRLNSSHLVISYAVFCLKKKTDTDATLSLPALHSEFSDSARGVQS